MSRTRTRSQRRRASATTTEITTFPNAIRYLYDRADIERMRAVSVDRKTFRLERTRKLLSALDNPQDEFRSVHVAGTVGKGSTVAMIASMLQACGYAVGVYTSPHLVDVRERIQINGRMISRNDFTQKLKEIAMVADALSFEPTFFELMTALAFKHFAEEAVDIAVIETGLGGRLDCTNTITPEVSIITAIDYDHMHLLGKTLPEIAREKAGIFKPGVAAIAVDQSEEVMAVLREIAAGVGAPLKFVNKEIEFSYRFGGSVRGPSCQVCLFTPVSRFEHVPVPLPGEHQALNCGAALAAIDLLRTRGYELDDAHVHRGLAETTLPGRMELIWDKPRILVDGAHNAAGLAAFVRTVGTYAPYDSMVCIFGCCEDKDIPHLLDQLALGGDKVIFTRARGIPRAAWPENLQKGFNDRCGKMSQVAEDIGEALNIASRAVGREDLICVTGSFYLVGETKKYLADVQKKQEKTGSSKERNVEN